MNLPTIDEALKYASGVELNEHATLAEMSLVQLADKVRALEVALEHEEHRAASFREVLAELERQEPVAYRIDWPDGLVELAWQADGYDEDYVEIRGLPTAVPLGEMPCAATKPAPYCPVAASEDQMNIEQLIADLRARVNPQYYDQIGTESYERHQCVLALESLLARIEVLRVQNAALRADAARIDWLADVNNTVGSVMLPREIVEANVSSLRQAIDAARSAKITQEPAL